MESEVGTHGNWLIVGLGNPGAQYERTRHNLGFMLIDLLAARLQTTVKRSECRALVGRGMIANHVVELAKPQTYMNVSGEAVSCLLAKTDRSRERLLVISDDLALPLGEMRIRAKGSHGGQNGLRSIIDCLKTQEFGRLRIGMAPEHQIGDASRFVLDNFSKKELESVSEVIDRAADAVETVIREGIDAAMARFN